MSDVNFKHFTPGIQLVPQGTSNVSQQGDLDVDSVSTKINYHNGTISSPLVTEAGTATLSNKTLNNTNIVTIQDTNLTIQDDGDNTKQFKFQASGITTGTLRTIVIPDATTTLVGTDTTQTIMNKTIDNSNTITIKDVNFTIQDDGDTTKQAKFQASGISTGTTRTFVFPDATTTLVGTDATQTLTNKSISGSTNTITNVSLTTGVTGTLPLANGGTNASLTASNGAVAYSTSTALALSAVGTSGYVLTSAGAGTPTWNNAFVPVQYNTAAGQTIANNTETIVDFGTSVFDPQSTVTTGATWKFTAPTTGYYWISALIAYSNNTTGTRDLIVKKNGSSVGRLDNKLPNATGNTFLGGGLGVQMTAGDFIDVRTSQDAAAAASINLSADANNNHVTIFKIA